MTFSDKRVVDLVKENFVAVWESVADVSVAVFELGDGRTLKGTVGGEIALYFCRPDGKVFDILPALHSPNATYQAVASALEFYRATGATEEAIRERHAARLAAMDLEGRGYPNEATVKAMRQLQVKKSSPDEGTRALSVMAGAKTGMIVSPEPLTVVEPGGLDLYLRPLHGSFASEPLRTPQEWKEFVFVDVLDQTLQGGERVYDVDTLAPISIEEE